ncbi:MAG: prepilin-type N-terminal cleavage/methylation domain-containing protein, partial [Gammaproteobacteria bacterium]|nr:prepilin-type N-terminal cleavage/methylation domain-containing protein [Gammaproteobacteria bacterium]
MEKGKPRVPARGGFTLIEVLVSVAVLVVLMLALMRMFMGTAGVARRGTTMLMRNSTAETAMETMLRDVEGMVVNERLACYVRADASDSPADPLTRGYGFGFDEAWFISTEGDQDDDMPYEYIHYFVSPVVATGPTGEKYLRFDLMKERMIFAVGDSRLPVPMYALSTNDTQWWKIARRFSSNVWDRQTLADNVVRFDVYCLGWTNPPGTKGWMAQSGGIHEFDSSAGPNLPGLSPAQQ